MLCGLLFIIWALILEGVERVCWLRISPLLHERPFISVWPFSLLSFVFLLFTFWITYPFPPPRLLSICYFGLARWRNRWLSSSIAFIFLFGCFGPQFLDESMNCCVPSNASKFPHVVIIMIVIIIIIILWPEISWSLNQISIQADVWICLGRPVVRLFLFGLVFFSLFFFFWPRFPSLMAVSFPCSLKGSAIDCIGCTEFPSKNFKLGFGSNRFWLIPSFTNFLSKEKNCDCHLVVFIFSILVRLVQLEPTGISWISANQLSNGIWVIWVQLFVSMGLPDDVVINRSWARYRKWVKRGGREGAVTLNYECYILFTLDMRQIGCQPTMIIIDGHHWTSIPL